jgi:ribosomal protein S18 acetylase RimI-like enzyme
MYADQLTAPAIRAIRPDEYVEIGRMLVKAYAALPGMPQPAAQPEYYSMLADVERRCRNSSSRVFVATDANDIALGSIDFIADMKHYGAASSATQFTDAAGIRLLAIESAYRGNGAGKALTRYCIDAARALGKSRVVLHSTRFMQTAWIMYERMGFERLPAIDFVQGRLEVFGFELDLRK